MTVEDIYSVYGHKDGDIYQHFPTFLRLFRYEFDCLLDDTTFVKDYRDQLAKNLSQERINKLESLVPSNRFGFTSEDKRFLYKAMFLIPANNYAFWKWFHCKLIEYIQQIGNVRLRSMLMNAPENEKENFDIFFRQCKLPNQLDCVAQQLMVEPFIKDLNEMNIEEYRKFIDRHVIPKIDPTKKNYESHYATCELLRSMFYSTPGVIAEKEHSWYMDFLYACTKNVRNGTMLKYLDDEYHIKLEDYVIKLNANTNKNIFESEDLIDENEIVTFRPPTDQDVQHFAPDPDSEGIKLDLRGYQKELARFANEGTNTVICAPTGSGKTVVAIDIIQNHLLRRNYDESGLVTERSRVVFIVPTVPLVDQQRKLIQTYLGDRFIITGVSGADNRDVNRRASEILNSHVVVSTAQVLVNLLTSVNRNRRLYISDFTLFVLDECHHCDSKHPYELMMHMVRDFTEGKPKEMHPQVVGLTASIGTKGGVDASQVEKHIFGLCVRMLATQISTVRDKHNLSELHSYVSPPVDEIKTVKRPENEPFRNALCELVIDEIVKMIKPIVDQVKDKVEKLKEFKFRSSKESAFRMDVQRLIESTMKWPKEFQQQRVFLLNATKHLQIYLHGLKLNELLPSVYAYKYIGEKFTEFIDTEEKRHQSREEKGQDFDEFYELYKDHFKLPRYDWESSDGIKKVPHFYKIAYENTHFKKSILETLKGIIETQYKSKPETRALIFVETRNLAHYLSEYLNLCGTLKEFGTENIGLSRALTSSNQSTRVGGVSSVHQKLILDGFSSGKIKILVVTSLAEEGIDISACNLIIKYNSVGSERTMIQRRGRARAKGSKSMLICLDGDVEQREIRNVMNEQLLHQCILNLQAKSARQLYNAIDEERQERARKAENEKIDLDNHNSVLSGKIFELKCFTCHQLLCTSDQIRSVMNSHYCCVDPKIWSRITIENADVVSSDEFFVKCGVFKCKGNSGGTPCNEILGYVVSHAEVFMPSLKHSALALQQRFNTNEKLLESDRELKKAKKWSEMSREFFLIPTITTENLLNMSLSLKNYSSDNYDQVCLQRSFAIQYKIEKIKAKKARKNRHFLAEYGREDSDDQDYYNEDD